MSDKTYLAMVCYGEKCSKKRIKSDNSIDAELVGIIGVAMKVDGKLRNVLILGRISFEDFKILTEKYGIDISKVKGYIVEIKEEKKGEREVGFTGT